MTQEQITESTEETVEETVEAPEAFQFDGKEYKTEAAMKAAITRKANVEVKEKKHMHVLLKNVKHDGTRYFKGNLSLLSLELEKIFKEKGFIA